MTRNSARLLFAALCLLLPRAAAAQPTCLFLHGSGVAGDNTFSSVSPVRLDAMGNSIAYWGDTAAHVSDLCTPMFANFDTVHASLSDPSLMQAFYSKSLEVTLAGGVVFAHGSANDVLARSCNLFGLCSVRWYGLGAMLRGSGVAALAAVRDVGFAESVPSELVPQSWTLGPLAATVRTRNLLRGLACGTNSQGSGGRDAGALIVNTNLAYGPSADQLAAPLTGSCRSWRSCQSDGLVHVDECGSDVVNGVDGPQLVEFGAFQTSTASPFFLYPGNHWDLVGAGGNFMGIHEWMRAMIVRH